MSVEEFREALVQQLSPLVRSFPAAAARTALQDFAGSFYQRHFQKGDHFTYTGDVGGQIGYIVQGVVRTYHALPDGSEYTKTIFQEGQFVAPLATLTTGEPSPIALQMLTAATLLVADSARIEQLYRKHHCLDHLGRLIVQQEWVAKEIREIRLVTLSAQERYELFLKEYPGLEQRIPWYYIASLLGITPVALSRIRARLKKASQSDSDG